MKEEQEELLNSKERELSALKGALKEELETHDNFMSALKDEYENEFKKLLTEFDLFKEVICPHSYTISYFQLQKQKFLTYYLTVSHRATLSWVKRRPKQKRREVRLWCS